MSIEQYRAAGNGRNLTPEQINAAFRDYYGIDAPPKLLAWFQNESPHGDDFYNRVQSGVFTTDIANQYPDFLERSKNEKAVAQQIAMQKQYNAPLIPTLEASKTSLQARYDAILADLTNTERKDTEAVQKNATAEFAKRGIPLSSDAYARELASQLSPVNQDYAVKRGTFAAQNATDQNAIDKAIADLRAGRPDVAIPAGNSQYGTQSSLGQNVLSYNQIGLPAAAQSIKESNAKIESQKYADLTGLIKQFQGLG